MSILVRMFVFVLTVFIVVGCGSAPIKEVVTETKYRAVTIPDGLLVSCSKPLPPNKDNYASLSVDLREEVLIDYSISLLSEIDKCNKQIKKIATFQAKILEDLK